MRAWFAVLLVTVCCAVGGMKAYSHSIDAARDAAATADLATIRQAAQVAELTGGVPLHTALLDAAAQCACAVAVDPSGDRLVYRSGDQAVYVDARTGATTRGPVTNATPERPEPGLPATVAIDLGS